MAGKAMKIECRDTLRIKLKGRWKNAIYLFNRTDNNPRLPEFWDTEKDVKWVNNICGWEWSSSVVWANMVFLDGDTATILKNYFCL